MHELGRSDEGLSMIERHANLFRSLYDNKSKYVEARTIYAVVLLKRQEYSRALAALEESAAIAKEEKDTEVLAYILNNIGLCWVNLGNLTSAKECLTAAAEMFAARNLRTESARVRGSLALLLIRQGRYNDAISEYFICRNAFMELNAPVLAAQAALRVVETLFLAGRTSQVPSLCAEIMAAFRTARLPREAQKALAYLNELAQKQKADELAVEHVRCFFENLEVNPDAEFRPKNDEG
jgi:tetratricopeptide (TPR) repeat protein